MRTKLAVTLGVIALVVPFVLAQQATEERETGRQQDRPALQERQPGHMGAGQEKNIEQNYLKHQIQSNMFAEQAAKLVADKAPEDSVKQFAQKLQEDHKENNQQLKQIAQQKQMQVPNQMAQWQQGLLQEMQQLDPQTLQREFLFGTVAAHHKDILSNKFAAQKAQDNEVKQLATRTLPTLQQHLQQANRLTQQVTGISPETPGVAGR
jgi:putative membrane protein